MMNSNFKRKKPKIYLAGGMENAPNFGVEWRERAEKWVYGYKFGNQRRRRHGESGEGRGAGYGRRSKGKS